jgi:hypothetical protein
LRFRLLLNASGGVPVTSVVRATKYTPQHAKEALEILERLLPHVTPRQEFQDLIFILRDPTRWRESHEQFTKIRVNITLPFKSHKKKNLDHYFTDVAENAAKTAYNCSGEPAPFDDDSFSRLQKCEQEFLERSRTND